MKKIFTVLSILLFSVGSLFAADDIDVEISNTQIFLGETFEYRISLDTNERQAQEISIEIPGVENFRVFSTGQSYSYKNINGETQGFMQYIVSLQANTPGDFTLGPVKILAGSGEIIDDETIELSVGESVTGNPGNIEIPEENNEENIQEFNEDESSSTQGLIKPMRKAGVPLLLIVSFLVFCGAFYYILLLMFRNKSTKKQDINTSIDPSISKNDKIIKYFKNLGDESKNISSQEFFKKYNSGLREVFLQRNVINAHKITLSELSKIDGITKSDIFPLFKKSYKHEYSGVDVSVETRNKYIIDILGLLK